MAHNARDRLMRRVNISTITAISPKFPISETPSKWNSKPMYQLPPWGEPLVCFSLLRRQRPSLTLPVDGLGHPSLGYGRNQKTELPYISKAKKLL